MILCAVLVTGANGFLGAEVVRQLLDVSVSVRATGIEETSLKADIEYYQADIIQTQQLAPVVDGISTVIHTAGLAHVFAPDSPSAERFRLINEIGTANVVSAAADAGVRYFILISSVSVYGPFTQGLFDENVPYNPVGPYALSKYNAEQRAQEIAKKSGIALTILRLATLYGEGDPGNVGRLMRMLDKGRFLWIGDGSNQKSLLHKEDAARAILKVVQTKMNGINIFNVSAPPCTMREIVEGLSTALGRQVLRWHIPAPLAMGLTGLAARLVSGSGRLGTLHDTVQKWLASDIYNTTKFDKTFDFKTQVKLSEGLNREVAWYRHLVTPSSTT